MEKENNVLNHSVTIGGKINLGNYSALDIHVEIGLSSDEENLEDGLRTAISTARTILGETLIECLKVPTEPHQITQITAKIPPNLEVVIKNNPYAVWLISSTIVPDLEDLPF